MSLFDNILAKLSGQAFPPGHFYSPIPDLKQLQDSPQAFDRSLVDVPGVNLEINAHIELCDKLARYYSNDLFPTTHSDGNRYYFDNPFFSYGDAIALNCILRYLAPTQVIEVGCGFSSAAMLDTNDKHLQGSTQFTFIEPYPQRLASLLRHSDKVTIHESPVQAVPLLPFQSLTKNDVLFIDGSHVLKTGSDVADVLFRILPTLQPGVWIHFHDIFFPFDYPRDWVLKERRAWNEGYALRAFLQFNNQFKIRWWNDLASIAFPDLLRQHMPQMLKNTGGSIWLERVET